MDSQLFGALPVKRSRGEGGLSDLATRISNNIYNDYVRYTFDKKELSVNISCFPGRGSRGQHLIVSQT